MVADEDPLLAAQTLSQMGVLHYRRGDYAAAEAPLPGVFHFTGNLDRARARALCDQVRDLIR